MEKKNNIKKRICVVVIVILVLIAIIAGAFYMYVSDYYRAKDVAIAAAWTDLADGVSVSEMDGYYFFDGEGEELAYIFYPGAKVEAIAYAPLMREIAANGMDVYLVKMPFNLAFFGLNSAGEIMEENTYAKWYIGGHSLGGAMSASYAADNISDFAGVILMASYPTKSLNGESTRVLSIYGSNDEVLNMESFEAGRAYMPSDYTEYEIEGGNHAYFADYGEQDGDGVASITASEQQSIVLEKIIELIER